MRQWWAQHWTWALIGLTFSVVVGAMVFKRFQSNQAGSEDTSGATGAIDESTGALQVAQVQQLQERAALAAASVVAGQTAFMTGQDREAGTVYRETQAKNDISATLGTDVPVPTAPAPPPPPPATAPVSPVTQPYQPPPDNYFYDIPRNTGSTVDTVGVGRSR